MAETNGKNEQLKAELAGTAKVAKPASNSVFDLLEAMKPQIQRALPKHITADRIVRVAMTSIRTTPALMKCDGKSLLAAVMQTAQLGLEPGTLGHAYLVPYGNQVQFILGYRGMLELIRRSGNVSTVSAHVVYQNDRFVLRYGLNEDLEHVPWHCLDDPPAESGDVRGAYLIVRFTDGGYHQHYMPVQDIEAHRNRSKAKSSGPWQTDYEAMCLKTVVRDAFRWLPVSVEIARQVEHADEQVRSDIVNLTDDAIDVEPEVADVEA